LRYSGSEVAQGESVDVAIENPRRWADDRSGQRAQPARSGLARLLHVKPDQVVAYWRLAFALLGLAAIYLDPLRPGPYVDVASALVGGYVVFAAVLAGALTFDVSETRAPLVHHLLDLAVCVAITLFTRGPTGPQFIYFTFAILAGALRWESRGALSTALALAAFFLAVSYRAMAAGDYVDVNGTVTRAVYLAIAGLLFGYVGSYRQRHNEQMARLATLPELEAGEAEKPSVTELLRRAALVLQMDHVVVVWEDVSEPGWRVSLFNGPDGETERPGEMLEGQLVAEPLANLTFLSSDATGRRVLTQDGIRHVSEPIAVRSVLGILKTRSFASAPLQATRFRGRVFIADPDPPTAEFLTLTEIVASLIGIELEHFGLRAELETAAAARERMRLARDIHDGILQDLTAAGLELKAMSASIPAGMQTLVSEVLKVFAGQQRRIREFVAEMNPKPAPAETMPLGDAVRPLLSELEGQWKCRIDADLRPEDAMLRSKRAPQLRFILAEGVANAVRHGKATRITVTIELDAGLWVEIRDNGSADGSAGSAPRAQAAPFSLRQRVREMGGGCSLTVDADGGTLVVALPAN
jgi:signal transduction histidine kinase